MKKKICLIIIFILTLYNMVFAGPIVTPYFHFFSGGQKLQLGLKEIYIHEKDAVSENTIWSSDLKTELNYSIFGNFEFEFSLPYTTKNSNKQSGLNDSKVYLKYPIYSNQDDLMNDLDLDIALQLGWKIKTGEEKKGLKDRENELLVSLLGKRELGKFFEGDCFFYFHLGTWLPVIEDYYNDNVFQYDFALEYKSSETISFLLEGNGLKSSDKNQGYIAPGFQFRPKKNLELNLSVGGNIPNLGESLNTKTIAGINYIF